MGAHARPAGGARVATAITGIPELVETGETGWLVPVGSVDALADALGEVLDASPAKLARLGREGARRVAERHDARVEAARLAELFRDAEGATAWERERAAQPGRNRVA